MTKRDRDIKQVKYYITVYNYGQKGRGLGHVLTFKILGHLYSSGTSKATHLKFGVQIDCNEEYSKIAKLGDKRDAA